MQSWSGALLTLTPCFGNFLIKIQRDARILIMVILAEEEIKFADRRLICSLLAPPGPPSFLIAFVFLLAT